MVLTPQRLTQYYSRTVPIISITPAQYPSLSLLQHITHHIHCSSTVPITYITPAQYPSLAFLHHLHYSSTVQHCTCHSHYSILEPLTYITPITYITPAHIFYYSSTEPTLLNNRFTQEVQEVDIRYQNMAFPPKEIYSCNECIKCCILCVW